MRTGFKANKHSFMFTHSFLRVCGLSSLACLSNTRIRSLKTDEGLRKTGHEGQEERSVTAMAGLDTLQTRPELNGATVSAGCELADAPRRVCERGANKEAGMKHQQGSAMDGSILSTLSRFRPSAHSPPAQKHLFLPHPFCLSAANLSFTFSQWCVYSPSSKFGCFHDSHPETPANPLSLGISHCFDLTSCWLPVRHADAADLIRFKRIHTGTRTHKLTAML